MTRIDRRALFTSGAAAALLAASGASVSGAPSTGGNLRIAVPRDGEFLDQLARGAIYDGLTEIAPDGVLRGELAIGWHSSEDARTWTFDLRQDVKFHDGSAMQARDVVASLQAQNVPGGLASVSVTKDWQVRLTLRNGNPDLPYRLSDPTLIIAKDGLVDAPWHRAIGTGCYACADASGDRHFRAVKVADHYKTGRAGWVDRLDVAVIPDASVRAEALRDGFVDIAVLPHPDGLLNRGTFQYHPSAGDMVLASQHRVGQPRTVSPRGSLDDGRIAERWWLA
jgi:peptide/nickel transport system substrate-binding protein